MKLHYDKKRQYFGQKGVRMSDKNLVHLTYSHRNCTAEGGGTSPGQLVLQRQLAARDRGLLDVPCDLPSLRTPPAPTSGNHPEIPSNQFD